MSTATVSMKGQITLPTRARQAVGIKPHDRVTVETRDGGILIRPAPDLMKLQGFLGKALPRDMEREAMAAGVVRHKGRQELWSPANYPNALPGVE